MVDWILNNKEWLFSGIGVVIVVLFFKSIRNFFKVINRKLLGSNAEVQPTDPVHSNSAAVSSPPQETLSQSQVMGLTPDRVFGTIENAVPFLKVEAARQFIGALVEWEGDFTQFHKYEHRLPFVGLSLSVGALKTATVFVDQNLYPGLVSLQRGDRIKVNGEIESLDQWNVYLKNATIVF